MFRKVVSTTAAAAVEPVRTGTINAMARYRDIWTRGRAKHAGPAAHGGHLPLRTGGGDGKEARNNRWLSVTDHAGTRCRRRAPKAR